MTKSEWEKQIEALRGRQYSKLMLRKLRAGMGFVQANIEATKAVYDKEGK